MALKRTGQRSRVNGLGGTSTVSSTSSPKSFVRREIGPSTKQLNGLMLVMNYHLLAEDACL